MRKVSLFTLIFTSFALAQDIPSDAAAQAKEKYDYEVIQNWIQSQKDVSIKQLGGRLSISGEVRTELQAFGETRNGVKQRGYGGETFLPSRAYDIEVNLMIDYRAERTWASVKLEFDNNAGISAFADGSGTFNRITTERAFFGARFIDEETYTMDLIFGRRRLNYSFDSFVEFNSFMDGILFQFDAAFDRLGDIYLHAGPFVVNENFDHYAWVGEIGILNVWDTGLYGKYSLIDWNTKHFANEFKRERFRFCVSQLSGGYKFAPKPWNKMITLYWAWLINSAAQGVEQTNYKKENMGGYLGFSIGEARRKGDWSFDVNYQMVQAQAIPGFDSSGIGRGNAQSIGLYSQIVGGKEVATTNKTATGETNYRGISAQLLYLWTNNLTIFQSWSQSVTLNKDIGPFMRYKMYEVELIYAF